MKWLALALIFTTFQAQATTPQENVARSIETEIGRQLDGEESAAVYQLFNEVERLQSTAAFRANGEATLTYLGCVGGKIALIFKKGLALCSDIKGKTYLLKSSGKGLSAGLSASGQIVVHSGGRDVIRGTYGNGAPATELEGTESYYKYAKLFAKFTPVELDYFKKLDGTDAKLFFVGLSYGPYFNMGKDTLTLE